MSAVAIATAACQGTIGKQGVADHGSTPSTGAAPVDGAAGTVVPGAHPWLPSSFDDRYTTLATPADVAERRQALIETIWSSGALPNALPNVTRRRADEVGAAIPAGLDNLDATSVFQLDFPTLNPMPPQGNEGGNGMAYLLSPAQAPRHRVVVLNTGHIYTFDEDESGTGMRNVVQALLTENYSVLLTYMPHFTPSDATGASGPGDHNRMFSDGIGGSSDGDPRDATNYRYFLEPTIVGINFLVSEAAPGGAFSDVALAGLSGGGWTTTLVAALDPRARLSVSVAGSVPQYIENANSMDAEQVIRSRLGIGAADLYVLGADGAALGGAPRRQTQVLNRRDSCCFGENQFNSHDGTIGTWQSSVRLTERNVRSALYGVGSSGRWRLEIDEMSDHHMISASVLQGVLLAELDDDRKLVGAANVDGSMFYRGVGGDLFRRTFPIDGSASAEFDTGIAIAGLASVAEGGPNTIDVFARDSTTGFGADNLIHYYLLPGQSTWQAETLPAVLMADPAVVAGGGTYDVFGLANDGSLFHVSSAASGAELVSAGTFVGPPAPVRFQDALHVVVRGKDMNPYHAWWTGTAWSVESLPLVLSGFPTASLCGDRLCLAGLGADGNAYVGALDASGSWGGWSSLPTSAALRGTPSLAETGGGLTLYAPTTRGTLGRFFQRTPADDWIFSELAACIASPTAIQGTGGVVASGGQDGALWIHRTVTAVLGGWFD